MTNQSACRMSRNGYPGSYERTMPRNAHMNQGYTAPKSGYSTSRITCPITERDTCDMDDRTTSEPCFTSEQFPIGMTYVPMQCWQNLYCPEKALEQGTLFADLDKPFLGRRITR